VDTPKRSCSPIPATRFEMLAQTMDDTIPSSAASNLRWVCDCVVGCTSNGLGAFPFIWSSIRLPSHRRAPRRQRRLIVQAETTPSNNNPHQKPSVPSGVPKLPNHKSFLLSYSVVVCRSSACFRGGKHAEFLESRYTEPGIQELP
jgi:hypothetical protein